ncbi:4'-phosphopantetheinyl transferase superfamily protein [Azospirillum sp. RWY-5-1]|uniref:4'-phosphopantetheinyl transferase superfamily protein n=1 Tax=Azospirillum oleiclasticum TaxID=2735135 RepID=A0ABX2TMV6_9PROT|nr:4'-phosphopantetheinyl transferase superfamily protein [Azospirillum oleiclasticum]NYZ14602.1 4'-phosphopantetheinyl transferase superfamily protein [Azospirillum oleiclasticum]NYZ24380.1 4'-phosphopantetheinyl transferase superfamily protein [Azospirillum oleiclasticum]
MSRSEPSDAPLGGSVRVATLITDALAPERRQALLTRLSPADRGRSRRFRFDADRDSFIAAHGLLDELLQEVLGCEAAMVAADHPGGKPRLRHPTHAGVDVNLSHTRGLAAAAVAIGCAVGVDCERLDRRIDDGFAEAVLAPEEAAWLRCRRGSPSEPGFLHLWTLKEAVLKADGRGLGMGLTSFAVLPNPPRMAREPVTSTGAGRWTFRQWCPTEAHVVALAVRGGGQPGPRISHWRSHE